LLLLAKRLGMKSGSVSDMSLSFTGETFCGSFVPHTPRFTREATPVLAVRQHRLEKASNHANQ